MTTRLYSNELKALVVPESILEQPNVLQEKCLTIQWMNYKCQRERNNRGEAYGPTQPVEMEFTIRLNDTADAKPFYQMLPSNEHFCFSFLFNATFNQNERLNDYEDGMVCDGYVVDIDESYSASSNKEPTTSRCYLTSSCCCSIRPTSDETKTIPVYLFTKTKKRLWQILFL